MSDNSTRWQRVLSQSGDKPRFQARQTTSDVPPPQKRSRHRSGEPSDQSNQSDWSQRWFTIGVLVLSALVGVLSWLVFFA